MHIMHIILFVYNVHDYITPKETMHKQKEGIVKMLMYSNHCGRPNQLNVYYDKDREYPWTLETETKTSSYRTLDDLEQGMIRNGCTSEFEAGIIKFRILNRLDRKKVTA